MNLGINLSDLSNDLVSLYYVVSMQENEVNKTLKMFISDLGLL